VRPGDADDTSGWDDTGDAWWLHDEDPQREESLTDARRD